MLFAGFDPAAPICFDVETITRDPKRAGNHPYHGDQIAGIAVAQDDKSMYLPIRHLTDTHLCLPFDYVMKECREFAREVKTLVNINVKFDLHFMAQDEIMFPNARWEATGALARIVHNRLQYVEGEEDKGYSLDALTHRYNTKYKKDADGVTAWLTDHGTKDYGAVPIEIMSKYAQLDALSDLELRRVLLGLLPEEARNVWENEIRFCRILWDGERNGVLTNPEFFDAASIVLTKRLIKSQEIITREVGWVDKAGKPIDFNPASWKDKDDFFRQKGIEPVAWGEPSKKTGKVNACWDGDALAQLYMPEKNADGTDNPNAKNINAVINEIIDYSEAKTAHSTFCVGWMDRKDSCNILHPTYNSAGTRTGRISSSDPNMQNPPPWTMRGLIIPEGMIGVKYDYSQIEYRIFAHFAKDEALLQLYADNPFIDFHQIVADRLGFGKYRKVVKPINFGILYGMGKKKLIRTIAKIIHDLHDPELMEYLIFKYGGITGSLEEIASNILEEYHRLVPAVKSLLKRVKEAIYDKGYVRNLYKRHLQFEPDKAYVALNYLCQSSAADLFKDRTSCVFEDEEVVASGAGMVFNIHDSIGSKLRDVVSAQRYWSAAKRKATHVPDLRVPILIDGEVAIGNWANAVDIFVKDKSTGRVVREKSIEECVDELRRVA